MSQKANDQGFITSRGRYLNRSQAAALAYKAGQINSEILVLFSEDLWSEKDGGKYKYDYVEGYHL